MLLIVAVVGAVYLLTGRRSTRPPVATASTAPPVPVLVRVDHPRPETMELSVAQQFTEARLRMESLEGSASDTNRSAVARALSWAGLGELYLAHNFPVPASQCFNNACLLAPENHQYLYGLAEAFFESSQVVAASSALARALEKMSANPHAVPRERAAVQRLLGECASRLGQAEVARRAFEAVLIEATNDFFSLVRLGQWHAQAGDTTNAISFLTAAWRQQPDHREVRQQLAVQMQKARLAMPPVPPLSWLV